MNKTILTNLFSLVVVSMIISSYQSASITSSDNKLDRDIIYDLITSEADAIYERLKSNTNVNSNFYQQQLAENEGLVSSSEVSRPSKRGRQCLWKICSWSLEKSKKRFNSPIDYNQQIEQKRS